MKLIRMAADRTGLLVRLPSGPHVVDIVRSLGVFVPHDPLANGFLNGALKDGCNWESIVRNWTYLRSPLKQLARIASIKPDHPLLAIYPFAGEPPAEGSRNGIIAIEITEAGDLEAFDPTGRLAMAKQFSDPAGSSVRRGAEIVDFSHYSV